MDQSRYVYDPNQKGMLEKAREAGEFLFWTVMIGGGGGAVYAHKHYTGLYFTIMGFFVGMSLFALMGIIVKIFGMK